MNRVQLERLVTPVVLISVLVVGLLFLGWGYSTPVEAQRPTVPSEPRDTPTNVPIDTPEVTATNTPAIPTATSTPEVTEEPTEEPSEPGPAPQEPAPSEPESELGEEGDVAAAEANGRLPLTGVGLSASLIAAALVAVLIAARSLRQRVSEDETAA